MSLEDILNREVTSVSKRPEKLFESAAAVFVIDGEDIRRSGARSLADALRQAPGLQVAQINRNNWAIASRGFNGPSVDKLLVLVDGRTVYSPIYNGVFWSEVNYLLEDIERIEVIRGPGGTLWGANAVNGVVNIITKDAENTTGGYVSAGGGSSDLGYGAVRYGAPVRDDLFARGYVQYRYGDAYPGGHDGSELVQGGGRLDWHLPEARLTLQGDYHVSNRDERVVVPDFMGPDYFPWTDGERRVVAANVLGRYERTFSDEADLSLQAYYDSFDDRDPARNQLNDTQIVDVEFQHRFPLPGRQSVTYGLGYRYVPSRLQDSALFHFSPNRRHQQVANAFIQDQIALFDDQLHLTLGTKLEHNDSTGFEVQPNVRLAWMPNERQTLWGAVSRAVQVPGPSTTDITWSPLTGGGPIPGAAISPFLAGANPFFVAYAANPDIQAQELISYELGHRWQVNDHLSVDTAGFYSRYDRLTSAGSTSVRPSFVPGTPSWVVNSIANGGSADVFGLEATFQWRLTDHWRVQGSYSWLHEDREPNASNAGPDAQNMATLRSSLDLPKNVEFDVMGRFVDQVSFYQAFTGTTTLVEAYLTLDLRLGWRPTPNLEFAVVGRNLLQPRQVQYASQAIYTTEVTPVPRSVFATVSLRF